MARPWRNVSLLVRTSLAICLGTLAAGSAADEQTDRLKITALVEEGDLLLDEANLLQPVTERLVREGEQLDQAEPRLREESAALDAAIAKFNSQNKDLERALQEHRQRCPRESEDKALVESCNAMAAGLQSVAQQLEQERPRLQTRQQELKARIEQHNAARRDWALRKRDHDVKVQANRSDCEPWLNAAKAFLASDGAKAAAKKAGDPAPCKAAGEPGGPGSEGVRRMQACLKALAAAGK
jgi:chromosome segregation ATPase